MAHRQMEHVRRDRRSLRRVDRECQRFAAKNDRLARLPFTRHDVAPPHLPFVERANDPAGALA
jgi:hypothetical protein